MLWCDGFTHEGCEKNLKRVCTFCHNNVYKIDFNEYPPLVNIVKNNIDVIDVKYFRKNYYMLSSDGDVYKGVDDFELIKDNINKIYTWEFHEQNIMVLLTYDGNVHVISENWFGKSSCNSIDS